MELYTEYAGLSGWKKIEAWRTVTTILGVSVVSLAVFVMSWLGHQQPTVQGTGGLPQLVRKNATPPTPSVDKQTVSAKPSSSQTLSVLIPIFRNLTQTTEQISLPAEACGQRQDSEPPLKVDRFSADARNLLEITLSRADIPVVKRERLAQAICEMELGRSGLVDKKTAAQLGKLVGATVQVEGTIDNIRVQKHNFKGYGVQSSRTTVTARLSIGFVSIETGNLLFSTKLEGEETSVSTNFGSMDDNDLVAAAIKNAIDNFENIDELKSKLTR